MNFTHDIMRLCPLAQTTDDVEELYGRVIDDAFGCDKQGRAPFSTFIPIWICTFLLAFGWCVVLLPSIERVAALNNPLKASFQAMIVPNSSAVGFGFLGTYFFALNFAFRRYVRSDLGPKAYSHLSTRVLWAIILVWVLGQIPTLSTGASGTTSTPFLLLVVAFFVGFIPETGMAYIRDFLRGARFLRGRLDIPTSIDGWTASSQQTQR